VKKVDGKAMVEKGQKLDDCQYEFNLGCLHRGAVSCVPVMMGEFDEHSQLGKQCRQCSRRRDLGKSHFP